MAQLRAEGEAALTEPNPPPRTYARHFPQEQPAPAFLYEQIRALNPPRQEAAVPGPTAEQVRALRTPTLLIVGEHDVIAPPALMKMFQNYMPHARLAEVAGAGHSVYFENPRSSIALCWSFLRRWGYRPYNPCFFPLSLRERGQNELLSRVLTDHVQHRLPSFLTHSTQGPLQSWPYLRRLRDALTVPAASRGQYLEVR